jgi:hypothetical protein
MWTYFSSFHSMKFSSRKWIPCVVCCFLLFFAATADFVSKAVVSGGFDADRPVVRIEHKCVSHSIAIGSLTHSASVFILLKLAVERPENLKTPDRPALARHVGPASIPIFPPLRC